ncbi:MAG TPA: methylated-DNA--[protein]-cysteine S-methyltransferase [Thermoleophilaceae bacterium]|nr:methylated-DNA--[protein]-cysteine S-methyltransferase [Thermoleophilaceae bacterium]
MSVVAYSTVDSPIGELLLVGDGRALRGLHMVEGRRPVGAHDDWVRSTGPFDDVRAQLEEYFDGRRTSFDVPLAMEGTSFQRVVWNALLEIPYGETTTYGELARRVGQPGAARAVGLANGSNPVAVIVPCHRVIGANGKLTGYGGGMQNKRILLDLERGAETLGLCTDP